MCHGLRTFHLHGGEVLKALKYAIFHGEVYLMGSAFILYMGNHSGFRGSFGAEGPPWSALHGLDSITQTSGKA